jgi:hypothetical protein
MSSGCSRILADASLPSDLLHAGLDRRALSGSRTTNRAGGARSRQPRLWASARERAEPVEFLLDIRRAKVLLEDLIGSEVRGYRAPSFSVTESNPWAFDCMAAAGYRYSSSVYPIRHDHYGMPDAPRFPYQARSGSDRDSAGHHPAVRPQPARWRRRLLPPVALRASPAGPFQRINAVDRRAAVFYLHPWEIDPEQPRVARASLKSRLRHYVNLHRTESRLSRLLGDFRWDRVDRVFGLEHSMNPADAAAVTAGLTVRPYAAGDRAAWSRIRQPLAKKRHSSIASNGAT